MTGKPFQKTRIIISEKIITTRTGVDSFDEAAINFKNNTAQSMETSRLNINAAIKSLGSGVISTKKLTYENTDNKTRTNSGGEPGMVEVAGGIRYQPESKNEPGKILSLFPSLKSRESNSKTSNFGWLDDNSNSNAEVYVDSLKNKPQIRIRKFQVNPKTDEIIPESEIVMSRFRKENESDSTKDTKEVLEKRLPGASLGDRGTSLIGRAAGKFGVVRDALGKFRCPPGTPAANQFTDYMGTNCFGQSVGDLVDFAVDAFKLAGKLTEPNSKNTLSKFFKNLAYDKDNGRFGSYFAVTVWRDADGNKIRNLRKWNTTLREGDYQLFPNGMTQAQARLALQDARVTNLMDLMGIVRTPETTKNNAHLHELFDKLRETGTLNVSLGDSSGNGKPFTPEEVETMITARLRAIDGFDELPKAQKQKITQNDIDRYYETEKALLESYLDEFIQNPEHIKTVPLIVYEAKIKKQDEASTRPIVWSTGNVGTQINIDIPHIMHTQETMLPQLNDNERLRIDVTGARTDAEAASALSDFLITSAGYSKQHAAMVEERAFARHIMKHEIAHSVQFAAFHAEIRRQLNDKGFIEVIGKDGNISKVESMDDLTSDHLMSLMDNVGDSIDLESLNSALSRTEVVMFMAGQYPIKDYRQQGESAELVAIEACAELWALRDLGLISGDDVDAALEWMDVVVDGRYVDKRIRSDAETMKVIEDSYYLNPGITSAPWYVPEDPVETATRKRRAELDFIKKRVSKMGQDEMVEILAAAESEKDRLEEMIESVKERAGDTGDSERELLKLLDEIKVTRSEWKKKYGVGGGSDKKTLDSMIDEAREKRGLFTPDVIAEKSRSKEIIAFKSDAGSIDDPDEIIAILADYEIRLREVSDSEKKSLKEEFKIYQDRYKKILKDSGDSRKWTEQKRELDGKIDELVRPTKTGPLKKPQTFSNDKAVEKIASERRNELMRGRTTRQRDAVIMFSDSETSSIAKILDPEKSSQVMNKIQLRNTRLKSRGKPIDPTSRSEGSVVDQIENILIPTMEVIDESRIGGSFEAEAVVEFSINEITGEIDVSEVSHDGFLSARVLSKKNPKIDGGGSYPIKKSKQKRRVIIQTTEEDRGIFPHWSMDVDKDDKRAQKLILPPGKLRIVETRDDGTVVMQISEQKDTESILSALPEALSAEPGIKKRTQRLVDEYIVERRDKGIPRDSKRPLRSLETQDRGIIATREIRKSGGRFGTGVPDEVDVDSSLLSGDVSVKTRGQRKDERVKSSKKIIEQLSDVLTGSENSDSSILSRDSLDPSVADIIMTKSPDEVIKLAEDTAVQMHETMDKRTRVRMRESEVDDITRTGRYELSSGQQVSNSTTQSQTGNRLSRRSKSQARNLKNQEEASRKAAAEFKKFKADDMDDGRLDGLDADTLKNRYELVRSKQKSVLSDRPIYKTSSAERAIALLALGYEVEVPHAGERRMTANSASQMAEEIKGLAKQHVDDMELKLGRKLTESEKKDLETDFNEKYDIDLCRLYGKTKNIACSDNMRIERKDMPQVGGKTESIDSPAMRAFISGHIKGEYKPVNGLSDDDMARFKRIAGELQKPKTYNNVSEEDRGWVHSRTNWATTETKMEENFIDFLNKSIKAFDDKGNPTDAVVVKQIDPLTVAASQNQLRASQIDGTAKSILKLYNEAKVNWGKPGTPEFYEERAKWLKNAWFQGPILTSRDGMVVDGHHRWSAIILANQSLKDDEKLLLGVSEIQAPIHEALALGKSFQEHMGIRSNSVGKQTPRATGPDSDENISIMTKQEFDAYMSDFDANFKSKTDDVKARGVYPVRIQNFDSTNTKSARTFLISSSKRGLSQGLIERVQFVKDSMSTKKLSPENGNVEKILGFSSDLKSKRDIRRSLGGGLITRNMSKMLDSEMKLRGVDKKIRDNVGFAISMISAYDKNASTGFLPFIGKEIARRGGKELAEITINKLVDVEKISQKQKIEIMNILDSMYIDSVSKSTHKNLISAFDIASSMLDKKTKSVEWNSVMPLSEKRTTGRMNRQDLKSLSTKDANSVLNLKNDKADIDPEGKAAEQTPTQRVFNRKGSAANNYRTEYLSQIGIPRDTPDSQLPVSGYVVNKSHIDEKKRKVRQLGSGNEGVDAIFEIGDKDIVGDGLTALGEIEVVLRPETANRVAYGRGNSIDSLSQPVMLDSTERDDIVDAIMTHNGVDKENKNLDTMLHLLAASKDRNFSHINGSRDKDGRMKPVGKIDPSSNRGHEVFEANILGGFSKDEIEGIHYPYSKIIKLADKEDISDLTKQDIIGPKLQKLGFTPEEVQYFYSISNEKPINTASMQKLKEYRAAKKIKEKYESSGIGYVKFAHPLGINIENPKTYDKTSSPRDNPEDILKKNIATEIDEVLELMLNGMRKKKARDFVGRAS